MNQLEKRDGDTRKTDWATRRDEDVKRRGLDIKNQNYQHTAFSYTDQINKCGKRAETTHNEPMSW